MASEYNGCVYHPQVIKTYATKSSDTLTELEMKSTSYLDFSYYSVLRGIHNQRSHFTKESVFASVQIYNENGKDMKAEIFKTGFSLQFRNKLSKGRKSSLPISTFIK